MRIAAVMLGVACAMPVAAQTAKADNAAPAQPAPANAAPAPANAAPAPANAAPAQPAPANAAPVQPVPALNVVTPASAPLTPEAAEIKKRLEQKFPGATIRNVAKSGYFGLYEAQLDDQLVYTDAKANQIIVGSIYDINTKQNLTEERSRKLNRIAWDALPLDLAIKKVKGNGQRKLVVFSDADCPFCAKLETELKNVDDVTIYTFLFPIDQLHPDAARKSKMIWCAPDRVKAWDEFFSAHKLPDNKGDCDTPLVATQALGKQLRVNATPTLVFADGSVVPGALPKDRLETELTNAEAEAKKLAAAKKG
jgi:thiol:disulfide interchange protein DsbC